MDCYMQIALKEAQKAYKKNEVPIGAVLFNFNKNIIVKGHNKKNFSKIVTKHAEIVVIEKMCKKINDWRLEECVLYVTMEPCLMCIGAIIESRIKKVIIGCKKNNSETNIEILKKHDIEIIDGVFDKECEKIIKDFFAERRK